MKGCVLDKKKICKQRAPTGEEDNIVHSCE